MDYAKFKETELKYNQLKIQLDARQITPDEMKKELKKMMVLDENGHYWMIGGKTGKWYIYNGTDWKEATPYRQEGEALRSESVASVESESPVKNSSNMNRGDAEMNASVTQKPHQPGVETVASGIGGGTGTRELNFSDNEISFSKKATPLFQEEPVDKVKPEVEVGKAEREVAQVTCNACHSKIPAFALYCHVCGAYQKEVSKKKQKEKVWEHEGELLIASIKIASGIFFLGGLGLIIGVLVGAGVGIGIIKDLFTDIPFQLPEMLSATQGGFAGGLIYAAIGGILGFIMAAMIAILSGLVYNLIAFLFGGIRFKIKQ